VTPSSGSVSGGYLVTVNGLSLCAFAGECTVMLNGISVITIFSVSSTQLKFEAPAGDEGTGDVWVRSSIYGIASGGTNRWTYYGVYCIT